MAKLKFTLQHPIQAQSRSTGITITLSSTLALDVGVGGRHHALAALPSGQQTQYPLSYYLREDKYS